MILGYFHIIPPIATIVGILTMAFIDYVENKKQLLIAFGVIMTLCIMGVCLKFEEQPWVRSTTGDFTDFLDKITDYLKSIT